MSKKSKSTSSELEEIEKFENQTNSDTFEDDELKDEQIVIPKKPRPIWLSIIIMLVCLYMMFSYRADLFFYFSKDTPVYLGNAIDFSTANLPNNSYASIRGIRNPSKGITLNVLLSNRNIFQLMGTQKVFVETLAKDDKKAEVLHEELYSGRFMNFKDVSYFNTVRDFAAFNFGSDIQEDAILIKAHEKPGEMQHVIFIYLISLVIFFLNLVFFVKRLKSKKED